VVEDIIFGPQRLPLIHFEAGFTSILGRDQAGHGRPVKRRARVRSIWMPSQRRPAGLFRRRVGRNVTTHPAFRGAARSLRGCRCRGRSR